MNNAYVQDNIEISAGAFDLICSTMKSVRGFNLDSYKDKCIRRRIAIRIRATRCRTAEEYSDLLRQNPVEPDLLLKVLTIHVSQFFRNMPTFEKMRTDVIPYLLKLRETKGERGIKCWSVGCAGGEEPYSIALLLREFFPKEAEERRVTILATDVDASILETARAGVYGEERLVELPETMRERWFRGAGGKYHLLPEIKEMVDFRRSDLVDGDAFPESDLILCRNVLIYFERSQQEKILHGFADVLARGGIMIMGKSETLFGTVRRRFQTVCPVERIYRVLS
ncbi:MAG TPA: protein-glutamate O-methyltransferase CheR [Geobacteraceae bacterium]|nr:protein-glutamate O-methyltransferase CheR [Geobacteraceae bacterium]